MEDIIQKYKKEKRNRNITIVVTSLALAIWLNFLLANTNSGKYITSSVINSQISWEKQADLYLQTVKNTGNNVVKMRASSEISQVKSLSFSIAYNKENVQIKEKMIQIDNSELINVIENEWFNTVIINFQNPTNIKVWEEILSIIFEKENSEELESINLLNANITDNDGAVFSLSTSGVEF